MDQFARIVLGYHGCNTDASIQFAADLFNGRAGVADWKHSVNEYDWLGHGIYFWEHGPDRARSWAGETGSVIGAVIQLGRCFDLTDIRYTSLLREAYNYTVAVYSEDGLSLPVNRGRDLKLRDLDCLIINRMMNAVDEDFLSAGQSGFGYQTVRCPFEEGEPVFPGAMLRSQTHIQLSVRDPSCILGIFRPNL